MVFAKILTQTLLTVVVADILVLLAKFAVIVFA